MIRQVIEEEGMNDRTDVNVLFSLTILLDVARWLLHLGLLSESKERKEGSHGDLGESTNVVSMHASHLVTSWCEANKRER